MQRVIEVLTKCEKMLGELGSTFLQKEVAGTIKQYEGLHVVSMVAIDDLVSKGFSPEVAPEVMSKLADNLGNDYTTQLFWESLQIIGEGLGIPRCDRIKYLSVEEFYEASTEEREGFFYTTQDGEYLAKVNSSWCVDVFTSWGDMVEKIFG